MADAFPLSGRIAIVTGAARGIGRGVAVHLASLGAFLVLGDCSDSPAAEQLAAELNASLDHPPRAVALRVDVSDANAVKSLFDAAESAFGGRAHIIVSCAGICDEKYPSLPETSDEVWDRTFAVNARGNFLCCREASKRLVRGGGGRIVCFSSSGVGALRPGYGAYVASKAAVEVMVKVLAKELKGTGITANCVAPGPVKTPMFYAGKSDEVVQSIVEEGPMGRLGEVEDIAPVVGFLCTDGGGWVNGQVVRANGGYI
ncbi:NADPH-dependent aldehyde reductase-like protein, chloroplastic [Curcuma longa]|uniref:NADPH-dependent aldehyde reductase-like protein, chloroplastic n=1 Tax=Curcuma longa TaxID=136217 RepID=UPI003D9E9E14